jgi:hypothetical protein
MFLIVIVRVLVLVIPATLMVVIRVILIGDLALVCMCAGGCRTDILPSCREELL